MLGRAPHGALAIGVSWTLATVGCARATVQPPQSPDREGRTSARALLPPPDAPGPASVERAEVTPVYASEDNALPTFPPYALKAGCGGGAYRVRVFVGADGNVSGSEDLAPMPPGDRCATALTGAVHAAVSRWRYAPAFRTTRVPRPPLSDGTTLPPGWKQEPIPIFLDYEFTFSVVAGRPTVTAR
jgi:hypothetical protein